jgi:flavin reductase (DIM6/NTAB) family NADH-FMN oxidoreductase RutF
MHHQISPAILYWGTPVVLITTLNLDGSPNVAPMSSAWWLGHRCMLGLAATSQTTTNLLRTKHCVLNLPSEDMVPAINLLAKTTGTCPVPQWKESVGYIHVKDKFAHAGLTAQESEVVGVPRVRECPVQMECELVVAHEMMGDLPGREGAVLAIEVNSSRVHVEDELRLTGFENRVDGEKLRLCFMAFQEFYGMRGKVGESRLAKIGEENYRGLTGTAGGGKIEEVEVMNEKVEVDAMEEKVVEVVE